MGGVNSTRFNPFNKRLKDLEASDLLGLREVAEGWYVEYKGQAIPTKAFAKSLSAFANHYGGWLVVGVAESNDGSRTAASAPGLAPEEVVRVEQQLKDASCDCVNPSVVYQHQVIWGPCEELGLAMDKAVLVINIPPGVNAPYVHVDGRIYRRVADSSSPRPETDRTTLDMLWRRGEIANTRLQSLIRHRPRVSKAESETPYIHFFVSADPLEQQGLYLCPEFSDFSGFLAEITAIPFDNVYPSPEGYIARQAATNPAGNRVLTWEFNHKSHSRITLPINAADSERLSSWLNGYHFSDVFQDHLKTRNIFSCRILDLNLLFAMTIGLFDINRKLMKRFGVDGPLYAKVIVENVWRAIPYVDDAAYLDHIEVNGPPIIQHEEFLVPPGTNLETFIVLEDDNNRADGIDVALALFNSLGIPRVLLSPMAQNYQSLIDRALNVQRSRVDGDEH